MIQVDSLAFLYNIQGGQLLLIIFVGLILFGGKKLPEIAKSIGKAVNEFRRAATDMTQEISDPTPSRQNQQTKEKEVFKDSDSSKEEASIS